MKKRQNYPENWREISIAVKAQAGWGCIRCNYPNDPSSGHTLTVHHLDGDPSNCRWWNLVPLCQRCHLHIQGKVKMDQVWPFAHSKWFRPYAAGYTAYHSGYPDDQEFVMEHLTTFLQMEKGVYARSHIRMLPGEMEEEKEEER